MKTVISVVIPVFNSGIYLRQCLDSVINQTWKNLQIICVDDGSSDSSSDILNEYALKDRRILVLRKENEGVSVARNTALQYTTGEYIMFVDSDDWIELDTVEYALQSAKEHNADVVMWSYIRELGNESRKKYIFNHDIVFEEPYVKEYLYRRMVGPYGEEIKKPENMDSLCPIWNKLYRGELIRKYTINFYDIREIGTYEDGLFNLEFFLHSKKAIFIEKYFYHYRRNNIFSLTSVYKPQLLQQWDKLFEIISQHIIQNRLDHTYHKALSNRIALSCIALGLNEMECDGSAVNKIKKIRTLLAKPQYQEALKDLDIARLPIHWKVFFLFARINWTVGIYGLLRIIQKIRGK